MALIPLLFAGLMAPTMPAHTVDIAHGERTVRASYRPRIAVATRQVGMSGPGGRPSTQRCVWTATVGAERGIGEAGAEQLRRTLPETRSIEGSRHGSCMTARGAIRQEVAARLPELRSQLSAIAANDHPTLVAELNAAPTVEQD